MLIESLLQRHGSAHRHCYGDQLKGCEAIRACPAFEALDCGELETTPVAVNDGLVEFEMVIPVFSSSLQESLSRRVGLRNLPLTVSSRIRLIVKVSQDERHELLSILLLHAAKLFDASTLLTKMT